jgi:uncharacterized repeat protein (TIGR03847 family)
MAELEIELNPAEFLTLGTVGPKGRRVFYLQAGSGDVLVSLIIEKEQARALGDAIDELLEDLDSRFPARGLQRPVGDLELREPITPRFRVAQMGLGYDEDRDLIVIIAQAMTGPGPGLEADEDDEEEELPGFDLLGDDEEDEDDEDGLPGAAVARIWCSRAQLRALGERASQSVAAGRPDPRQNGRLVYYWT